MHVSATIHAMDKEERPRKLQKTEHDESPGLDAPEIDKPEMSGALPTDDDIKKVLEENGSPPSIAPSLKERSLEAGINSNSGDNEHDTTGKVTISKKQQKRLLRQQKWEEQREERKKRRREKNAQRKVRKREEWKQVLDENGGEAPSRKRSVLVPITLVLDCDWDELMADRERVSLAQQITRSYSENSKALYRSHMAVSSFNKLLKERFETVMSRTHEKWRGIRFMEEDFVHAAEQACEWMKQPGGGKVEGALANQSDQSPENGEIVYLSSDSPNTLTELKPFSTYIIGGLVDKNRHKGICYQKAIEKGLKTAKLPIGEYLRMATRPVLATNHVVEIMLKWLEFGDWGEAFLKVIPQRKGGTLKNSTLNDAHDSGEESNQEEVETPLSDDGDDGEAQNHSSEPSPRADAAS